MAEREIIRVGGREIRLAPDYLVELFLSRKNDECFAECMKLLEKEDNDIALHYVGVILAERNEYENAIACFYRLTLRVPELYLSWREKGFAEMAIDRFADAEKSFLELVKLYPKSGSSWACLSYAYRALGDSKTALGVLDLGVKNATQDLWFLDNARVNLLTRTDPNQAILFLHELQKKETDEGKKEDYGRKIYNLVLKNTDPLRRSGLF